MNLLVVCISGFLVASIARLDESGDVVFLDLYSSSVIDKSSSIASC